MAPAESMRCWFTTLDIQPASMLKSRLCHTFVLPTSPYSSPPVLFVMTTPPAPPAQLSATQDENPLLDEDEEPCAGCVLGVVGSCAKADPGTSSAAATHAAAAKRFIKCSPCESSAGEVSGARPQDHVPASADQRQVLVGEADHGDIRVPAGRGSIPVAVHPVDRLL